MGLINIFKLSNIQINFQECRTSNPGVLAERQECYYLCAMKPPCVLQVFVSLNVKVFSFSFFPSRKRKKKKKLISSDFLPLSVCLHMMPLLFYPVSGFLSLSRTLSRTLRCSLALSDALSLISCINNTRSLGWHHNSLASNWFIFRFPPLSSPLLPPRFFSLNLFFSLSFHACQ